MLKINKLVNRLSNLQPHRRFVQSLGFKSNSILFNPSIPELYQIAMSRKMEADSQRKSSDVSSNGAFCAYSQKFNQRLGQNSRIVKDQTTKAVVNWNQHNLAMQQNSFALAQQLAVQFLNHRGNCIVVDGYAGWDKKHRLKVRTFCHRSYHALFMKNMLIKPTEKQLVEDFSLGVDVNIYNACQLKPTSFISGGEAEYINAINLNEKKIAILGNQSAQQMKKSLFKIFQYYYPRKNILPLNASATIQQNGKVTLYFGLQNSQTTPLGLTSPTRKLVSCDSLAWGTDGVFNLEGGCYARILNSDHKVNSQIKNSVKYGTLVENANFYPNTRNINFYDVNESPNAKVSIPLNFMKNVHLPSLASHPQNIIFFTCDAKGVLPVVAKLTPQQAFYHFLSGYSSKFQAVDKNSTFTAPKTKFQSCYGQKNLLLTPYQYAKQMYEKIKQNKINVWIVNTGWSHGKYGQGIRTNNQDIETIVNKIIQGNLQKVPSYRSQLFYFRVPTRIDGINQQILYPQKGWGFKSQFQQQLSRLSLKFRQNQIKKLKTKDEGVKKIMQKGAPKLI